MKKSHGEEERARRNCYFIGCDLLKDCSCIRCTPTDPRHCPKCIKLIPNWTESTGCAKKVKAGVDCHFRMESDVKLSDANINNPQYDGEGTCLSNDHAEEHQRDLTDAHFTQLAVGPMSQKKIKVSEFVLFLHYLCREEIIYRKMCNRLPYFLVWSVNV